MYRLYIDETGNADLAASNDPNHRYLSLTGIVMDIDHVRQFATPGLNTIKHEILGHDPDSTPVMHRKDILQKNYPWHLLRDPPTETRFNGLLLEYLTNTEYVVITAVIDKQEHLNRYSVWRHDPYHYCLEVLIERYALWLHYRHKIGDVMGEVRGGNFDRRLENCFSRFYARGTTYVRADVIQTHLTSKNLKMKRKQENVTGLQIADLLAHPSALHIRSQSVGDVMPSGFGAQIVHLLIDQKYNRSRTGKIDGYGTKWLP